MQRLCPYDGDFKCSDGECLRSSLVCDGYSQCQSEEDEQNCSKLDVIHDDTWYELLYSTFSLFGWVY